MTNDIPQVSVVGLVLFNVFTNDINSGIKYILRKFADETKLCGEVNRPKGWGTIQGDLDRLELWAQEKLMRFSKSKCILGFAGFGSFLSICRMPKLPGFNSYICIHRDFSSGELSLAEIKGQYSSEFLGKYRSAICS